MYNRIKINSDESKTYLCDYKYEGATWSIEIKATSFEDAQKRLRALVRGEIVGELKFSIPVPLKESWVNKIRKFIAGRI